MNAFKQGNKNYKYRPLFLLYNMSQAAYRSLLGPVFLFFFTAPGVY
jgi:hypothetical protein